MRKMPWGPFKGCTIMMDPKENGHWLVLSVGFGWHDCSPLEDEKTEQDRSGALRVLVQKFIERLPE